MNLSKVVGEWEENAQGWRVSPGVSWCRNRNRIRVGHRVTLGDFAKLGDIVTLGHNVTLGDDVTLPAHTKIPSPEPQPEQ